MAKSKATSTFVSESDIKSAFRIATRMPVVLLKTATKPILAGFRRLSSHKQDSFSTNQSMESLSRPTPMAEVDRPSSSIRDLFSWSHKSDSQHQDDIFASPIPMSISERSHEFDEDAAVAAAAVPDLTATAQRSTRKLCSFFRSFSGDEDKADMTTSTAGTPPTPAPVAAAPMTPMSTRGHHNRSGSFGNLFRIGKRRTSDADEEVVPKDANGDGSGNNRFPTLFMRKRSDISSLSCDEEDEEHHHHHHHQNAMRKAAGRKFSPPPQRAAEAPDSPSP